MSAQPPPYRPPGQRAPARNKKTSSKPETPGKAPNMTRAQTRAQTEAQLAALPRAEWQSWPEVTIRLDDLPASTTTSNLWDWFSHEGEIAYMDINEIRVGQRNSPPKWATTAKIRFEPPPKRAFWVNGKYCVLHPEDGKTGIKIRVAVLKNNMNGWIRSPVCSDRMHPVKMTLHPLAVQFGSMTDDNSMKVMKTFSASPGEKTLKIEANLRFKNLTVFFATQIKGLTGARTREHKFAIDFNQMNNAFQSTCEEKGFALVLPLRIPPNHYWKNHDVPSTFSDEVRNWNLTEAWYRATDIVEQLGVSMRHSVTLHNEYDDPGYVDIGRWTTFRFILDGQSERGRTAYQQLASALGDFNVKIRLDDDFQVTDGNQAKMWQHLEHPPASKDNNASHLLQLSSIPVTQLSFEVRYQLEVCISQGLLNDHNISVEFLQKLAGMDPLKARLHLEYVADQNDPIQDPMSLFKNPDADAYNPIDKVPYYCTLLRKAVITPTTIRFSTPTVEISNRVMRRYSHIQDRFLRVQFVQESERGRITVNKDQNDDVWKRVLRTLYQGIRIGDRVYSFLAFGSSQLRQCGAYFFCPTEHVSCDDIRKWMGDFKHIKVVAKYAARLGQCFSTTREIRGISVPTIYPIPDIERDGYCFSDGVGKISLFVARMINEDMALEIFDQPSAYQFRMGGCKGVLTLWDDAKGTEVHVRHSQEKFKADFNGLEIIRCASFATATLNRQTITILECLGVPTSAFTDLLNHQLHSYELAMRSTTAAIDVLTKYVDENQTTLIIAGLLKCGFRTDKVREPFVENILKLWRSWSLRLLREKARILVEKSAFVLGCVDETFTLRGHSSATEGEDSRDTSKLPQIFLQITDSKQYNQTQIIRGVCLVGRNPSLHPGDIRIVEAIDCPKLRHLKDVVVFPAKGDRPVPNMLSGGDLDGDDFFIMWEPTLIPQVWNYPPMDYTSPKPQQLERDVNVDDLRNFFVKYMKNDALALIATSHLALADQLGPMSPKCLELARLHSKAVDYPKTGEPATLRRDQQPRKWPHFMEKKHTYHSERALGIIYDKVVNQSVHFKPEWNNAFDQRITQRFNLDNAILKQARIIKSQYDTAVRRLLSLHDLTSEFELWAGFAMSKPTVGSDYKQQEELGKEYSTLKRRFREICYDAAGGKQTEQIDHFVAAMYTVTEEETKIALLEHRRGPINDAGHILQPRRLEPKFMPLITFPWIFHWIMMRIAIGSERGPRSGDSTAAQQKMSSERETVNKSPPGEASKFNDTEKVESDLLGADILTHLPDGTIIHRGQTLELFDVDDSDAPVEETEDCEENAAADDQDTTEADNDDVGNQVEESTYIVDSETADWDTEEDDAEKAAETTEEAAEKIDETGDVDTDTDTNTNTNTDMEEENAMDRLANLVGFEEE